MVDTNPFVLLLKTRNARWSSLVARRAHNPKVGGSNPPLATIFLFSLIVRAKLNSSSKKQDDLCLSTYISQVRSTTTLTYPKLIKRFTLLIN